MVRRKSDGSWLINSRILDVGCWILIVWGAEQAQVRLDFGHWAGGSVWVLIPSWVWSQRDVGCEGSGVVWGTLFWIGMVQITFRYFMRLDYLTNIHMCARVCVCVKDCFSCYLIIAKYQSHLLWQLQTQSIPSSRSCHEIVRYNTFICSSSHRRWRCRLPWYRLTHPIPSRHRHPSTPWLHHHDPWGS